MLKGGAAEVERGAVAVVMASGDVASRVRMIVENMRANAESADKQASGCDAIASMAFASEFP